MEFLFLRRAFAFVSRNRAFLSHRLTFFLPFVDHVLAHLKSIFSEEIKDVIFGFYLIPKQLHKLSDEVVEKVKEEF